MLSPSSGCVCRIYRLKMQETDADVCKAGCSAIWKVGACARHQVVSLTGMPQCVASDGERSASVPDCFTWHLWCNTWHWPRFCHSFSPPLPSQHCSTSTSHLSFICHRRCVILPNDVVIKHNTDIKRHGSFTQMFLDLPLIHTTGYFQLPIYIYIYI